MRRAIGPFVATGVALMGAAAIVANPVVPPPADIRVTAAEHAAEGPEQLDVLDPNFLDSVDKDTPDWRNPVSVLDHLFRGLDDDTDEIGRDALERLAGITSVAEPATVVLGTVAEASANKIFDSLPVPSEIVGEVFEAITDIGSSFGIAGVQFIEQLGIALDTVGTLTDQVQAGEVRPVEALAQLVLAPLSAILTEQPQPITGPVTEPVRQPSSPEPEVGNDDTAPVLGNRPDVDPSPSPADPESESGEANTASESAATPEKKASAAQLNDDETENPSTEDRTRVVLNEKKPGNKFVPGSTSSSTDGGSDHE